MKGNDRDVSTVFIACILVSNVYFVLLTSNSMVSPAILK